MRYVSRVHHFGVDPSIPAARPDDHSVGDESELTAFRGLLVAASVSALFWGACFTVFWLLRFRG
jgi:hypothetical protein